MTYNFQDILSQILTFFQNNQILLTALGLGGAGTIIFWLKGIPQTIFDLLKREFTTELEVSNQNKIFYDILKLVEKMYRDKNLRKLKLTNGKWGDSETIFTMGYGSHLLKYKNNFLLITLSKDAGNQTEREKDSIKFLKLGRDHKIFDDIVKAAEEMGTDKSVSRIYRMSDGWNYIKEQKKRPLDSVFIEREKKDTIIKSLSDFINKEEWYLSHGIPYQLGILFYGPPGTGKTSLIKAIASYLNYNIYYLPTSKLYKMEHASSTLPDKCIMIIEDLDSNLAIMNRDKEENMNNSNKSSNPQISSEDSEIWNSYGKMELSEILNSLDGLFSSHGRILLATTNHLDSLDPAVIRSGRFDIKMEIGYVNNEILKQFIDSFFPSNSINLDNIKLKSRITVADLQNLILCNYKENDILEFCKI